MSGVRPAHVQGFGLKTVGHVHWPMCQPRTPAPDAGQHRSSKAETVEHIMPNISTLPSLE